MIGTCVKHVSYVWCASVKKLNWEKGQVRWGWRSILMSSRSRSVSTSLIWLVWQQDSVSHFCPASKERHGSQRTDGSADCAPGTFVRRTLMLGKVTICTHTKIQVEKNVIEFILTEWNLNWVDLRQAGTGTESEHCPVQMFFTEERGRCVWGGEQKWGL